MVCGECSVQMEVLAFEGQGFRGLDIGFMAWFRRFRIVISVLVQHSCHNPEWSFRVTTFC